MAELLLKDGTQAGKEDYLQSDIVKQMLTDAEAKGKGAADPVAVIQGMKPEDLLAMEPIRQAMNKPMTKEEMDAKMATMTPDEKTKFMASMKQSLSLDDLKDHAVVKQMLETQKADFEAGAKAGERFVKEMVAPVLQAMGKGVTSGIGDGGKRSLTREMMDEAAAGL